MGFENMWGKIKESFKDKPTPAQEEFEKKHKEFEEKFAAGAEKTKAFNELNQEERDAMIEADKVQHEHTPTRLEKIAELRAELEREEETAQESETEKSA